MTSPSTSSAASGSASSEAVLCAGKTPAQIGETIALARARDASLLLTRLDARRARRAGARRAGGLDYDPRSRTAILGALARAGGRAAGRGGDRRHQRSAGRARGDPHARLLRRRRARDRRRRRRRPVAHPAHEEELRRYPVVIVVAGMEGALFSVVAGMVGGVVIAVPTSTGYGVAARAADRAARGARELRAGPGHGQHRQRLWRRLRRAPRARRARRLAGLQAEPAFEPGCIASPRRLTPPRRQPRA